MNFEQFIKSRLSNAWITEYRTLKIYVRRTHPRMREHWGDYQLASMSSTIMGTGLLTKFLNKYEPKYQFYIENLLNPRLFEYFKRRGYIILEEKQPQCMLGPKLSGKVTKNVETS